MKTNKARREYTKDDVETILKAIRRGREETIVEPGYERLDYYKKKWNRSKEATLNIMRKAIAKKIIQRKLFYVEVPGPKSTRLTPIAHYKVVKN